MKVGVIGAGTWGKHHLKHFTSMGGVEVVGIVEPDYRRAAKICEEFGGFDARLDELLLRVDAVSICSPAVTHFEFAKAALSAGVHTFVEKPMCVNTAEADTLFGLVGNSGVVFQVGFIERFNDALRPVFDLHDDVPEVLLCTRRQPYNGRCLDVNVVYDLMIHDIDLAFILARGNSLTKVTRLSGDRDALHVKLDFIHGMVAYLWADRTATESHRLVSAVARNGKVESVDLSKHTNDPLYDELESFVTAIMTKRPPPVQVWSGVKAVRVAEEISNQL